MLRGKLGAAVSSNGLGPQMQEEEGKACRLKGGASRVHRAVWRGGLLRVELTPKYEKDGRKGLRCTKTGCGKICSSACQSEPSVVVPGRHKERRGGSAKLNSDENGGNWERGDSNGKK